MRMDVSVIIWHLAVLISSYRLTMGLKIIGAVKTWQPKMAAEPVEEAQQIGLWPARSLDLFLSGLIKDSPVLASKKHR